MNMVDAGGAGYRLTLQDELTRDLTSALSNATTAVTAAFSVVDRQVRSIGDAIASTGKKLTAVGVGSAAVGTGLLAGLTRATFAAGDFAEQVNKFEAVFRNQAEAVRAWGREYADVVGRSEQQLITFLARAQDTFVPLGFDRREAAELSKTVSKLAIDLASFNPEFSDEEALNRLLGGLIGNTENLRAFGVVASEAAIKAKALELGFDPKNLTAYEKAMAILRITIEGTTDAQEDAVDTAGSFNNSIKRFRAAIGSLQIAIGEPLREIAASFLQVSASIIKGIADVLKRFPVLTKVVAGLAVVMTALGAAITAVGAALLFLGTKIAAIGIALLAFNSLGGSITFVIGLVGSLGAAFTKALTGPLLVAAFKSTVASIVAGIALISKAVVAMTAKLAIMLVNPWTALILVVGAALIAVKKYYDYLGQQEEDRAKVLENERQRIVAQSFRDAGQAVPANLSKTLDIENARVVGGSRGNPLTKAQQELAQQIKEFETPIQAFENRMTDAAELLRRGVIDELQFQQFNERQLAIVRNANPANRERESLAKQLQTPVERLKESIERARELFSLQPELLRRAIAAAREQFRATDRATQLAEQLRTPVEVFRDAVAEARRLFRDDPLNLKRAIETAQRRLEEQNPRQEDPRIAAVERIRNVIKTDVERVAERIAEAIQLVRDGLLAPGEGQKFVQKLRDQFLGDEPGGLDIRSITAQSSTIASQIGAFAPGFDNTASEEKEYRRNQIKLQKATKRAVERLARKNPILL